MKITTIDQETTYSMYLKACTLLVSFDAISIVLLQLSLALATQCIQLLTLATEIHMLASFSSHKFRQLRLLAFFFSHEDRLLKSHCYPPSQLRNNDTNALRCISIDLPTSITAFSPYTLSPLLYALVIGTASLSPPLLYHIPSPLCTEWLPRKPIRPKEVDVLFQSNHLEHMSRVEPTVYDNQCKPHDLVRRTLFLHFVC